MTQYSLWLLLVVTACSGTPFTDLSDSPDGGFEEGDGAAAGGGAGVQPGAGSGGELALGSAGAGGTRAGSGNDGAPSGGTGEGGAPAAAGAPAAQAGGGAVATVDGAAPACTVPDVAAYQMPQSFDWTHFAWQSGSSCLHCVDQPCSTCSVTWQPVVQNGASVEVRLSGSSCSPVAISAGACGAEVADCVDWTWGLSTIVVDFELMFNGTEWQPDPTSISIYFRSGLGGDIRGTCGDAAAIAPPDSIDASAQDGVAKAFEALRFGCG